MDGHRRYDDEPKPSWYSSLNEPGSGQYGNPSDSGVHERPSGAFRLPEQRGENEYQATGSHSTGSHSQEQLRVPVRGPEYPTVKPGSAPPSSSPYTTGTSMTAPTTYGSGSAQKAQTAQSAVSTYNETYNEPTGVVPPVNRFQGGGRPYRNRRPVSAVVVGVVTLLLMIPVIMLLVTSMFDDDPLGSGVVPAVLLTLGLPLTGLGLFSLATGGSVAREAWMRPPVVYLPVGLVLILAAGLAVS